MSLTQLHGFHLCQPRVREVYELTGENSQEKETLPGESFSEPELTWSTGNLNGKTNYGI